MPPPQGARLILPTTLWRLKISTFHRNVNEICTLLRFHTAKSGRFLLTFRDDLSIPPSRVNQPSSWTTWTLKTEPTGCLETSVRTYQPKLWKIPNQRRYNLRDSNKLTNQMQQFYKFITWRFVSLNMFRAPPRLSSGVYNCIRSLWFYRWSVVVAVLLVVVWQTTTNNAATATLQQ